MSNGDMFPLVVLRTGLRSNDGWSDIETVT